MLENSINDGALYSYRFGTDSRPDVDGMLRLLKNYWQAVRSSSRTFGTSPRASRASPTAWELSASAFSWTRSPSNDEIEPDVTDFENHLQLIAPACAWTGGTWQLAPTPANGTTSRTHRATFR